MEELAGTAAVEEEVVKTPDGRPARRAHSAHSGSTGRAEARRGGKKDGSAQFTFD